MANSFYWYDLETTGTNPRWDRIVQFAGLRTDADLNILEDEYSTYVYTPDDVLPNPHASLVTGITPHLTQARGMPESEALRKINDIFMQPGTCVAGYNSLRFDDEFMRFSLYRNLLDPYAREWQQGNSRWDLIDLVRATGALRREGINWPEDEDGLPVYKLEELTRANDISHGQAHDAMSDVHATLGMAKLIKTAQPKLFEYYFSMRHKKSVRNLLEPVGTKLNVHVSALYPRHRFGVGPILSITRHPSNGNAMIVADLGEDIEPLLEMSADEIGAALFSTDGGERPPLKEIRINRCPFVAPIEVLNEENQQRLQIDLKLIKERARRLKQPGFADKVARAYSQRKNQTAVDVDAALYDGFLQDDDRSRCAALHEELIAGRWQDLDFRDKRLHTLAARMKARSYPALLDEAEQKQWRNFVITKLEGDGDWLNLRDYETLIEQLAAQPDMSVEQHQIMQRLAEHGAGLRARYGL